MKPTKLILPLFFLATFSFGQTLQQGVFTTVTLVTDVKTGHPVISCYNYEFEFAGNGLMAAIICMPGLPEEMVQWILLKVALSRARQE